MVMMIRILALVLALIFGATSAAISVPQAVKEPAGAAAKVQVDTGPAPVDRRALDLLKKMSDTLSSAGTVRFQARSMVPAKTPDGIWINLYGASRVIKQGPDKLFASTAGDFAPHDFYYDGKTITSYSPDKNLYAVRPAPPTIDEMIDAAYSQDGKSFPYADLLVSDPYSILTKGLVRAHYVGQSTLRPLAASGSVKTDHLVFSNKAVQWQIWIDVDDHLPRLVCATYLADASEPSYTVELGDWKLNEPAGAQTFAFKNVSKASQVEFRNPMRARRMNPDGPVAVTSAEGA